VDLSIFINYREILLYGLWVTIQLAIIMIVGGLLIGILWGKLATNRWPIIRNSAIWSYEIIRAVPALILLFWFHYPFQRILNIVIDPFITSALVFTILNAAYIADYIRTGILNVPRGQIEAGMALGISEKYIWRRIIRWDVLRSLYPTLIGQNVHMLKTIPIASMITVVELFRVAQQINAYTYKTIEVYTAVAVIYIIMVIPLTYWGRRLERSPLFLRRTI
jgi:polar amino acid transport system permease protein